MPRFLISGLECMCVLGNRPPLTKKIFTPNSITASAISSIVDNKTAIVAFKKSENLLEATLRKDTDMVAELLEYFHDKAGNMTYNSEVALSYAIQLAYYAAQKYYTTILELDTGKGYADVAYLPAPKYPDMPVLLIELKYHQSVDTAMDQVRKQNYLDRFEHYRGNILVIGINYEKNARNDASDFKHHTCMIVQA